MKKPLLISLSALAVLGVTTATTLYAQTATGSSVIARMKAAAAAFALSADLNPGQTGFESAPVSWKKTGNMLTAAEWNRMLELVAQGGGGAWWAGWENVPLTDTTDFDKTCEYRYSLSLDTPNAVWMWASTAYYYAMGVSEKFLMVFAHSGATWDYAHGVRSTHKNQHGYKDDASGVFTQFPVTVNNMQKRCGGGGTGTGTGTTTPSPTNSNLTYINPDNTDFAPLECAPGMNYMISPIAFSAESASSFTTRKMATLGAGNWQVKGTGFVRIRNKNSNVAQTLRVSSVLDSTTTNLLDSAPDLGMYANSFLASVSVPAGKTTELRVSVKNNTLHGGNILTWCTN